MGRVDGKVAFITGAARGQGRAEAVRLAEEGADIIAVDVCAQLPGVAYDMATPEDLAETVRLVEALDRRVVARQADVRDLAALEAAVAEGTGQLGPIDIVVANAGIVTGPAATWEYTEEQWQEMIDVNLTGVWKTVKAAIPTMLAAGQGGSIILTSSNAGLYAFPYLAHYTAAKHGVTGIMRSLAIELASSFIRCNSVHPTTVLTPMVDNPTSYVMMSGGLEGATKEDAARSMQTINAMPIPWVEAIDIANAVLYLACDESRYISGVALSVDGAGAQPYRLPHAG
jgi:SDR family mycofactocin-dependent oxidoreductase